MARIVVPSAYSTLTMQARAAVKRAIAFDADYAKAKQIQASSVSILTSRIRHGDFIACERIAFACYGEGTAIKAATCKCKICEG